MYRDSTLRTHHKYWSLASLHTYESWLEEQDGGGGRIDLDR